VQQLADVLDSLFPRMHAQPASPQTQRADGQQQVLDGGGAILQQIRKLPIVGALEVAADNDPQRCIGEHRSVRQARRDLGQHRAVADDDKFPRVLGDGRRSGHRRFEQVADQVVRHFLLPVRPDTPPREQMIQFRIHYQPFLQMCHRQPAQGGRHRIGRRFCIFAKQPSL
jgi:hypothetical protein